MHHGPGFFFQRHASDEIARALLGREARVLIEIEHAVLVEIAELAPVLLNHGCLHEQQDREQIHGVDFVPNGGAALDIDTACGFVVQLGTAQGATMAEEMGTVTKRLVDAGPAPAAYAA
jgi:hypothetical protein